MKTYDDIQTITQITADECSAVDLREEIAELGNDPYELVVAGAYNEESITVLYLPNDRRAGIVWGADAQWTDADSVDDALQRFFGVDDKEMVN